MSIRRNIRRDLEGIDANSFLEGERGLEDDRDDENPYVDDDELDEDYSDYDCGSIHTDSDEWSVDDMRD